MKRIMLKSKIHMGTVTDADINYEGSITIDGKLMSGARLVEYEQVDIYSSSNRRIPLLVSITIASTTWLVFPWMFVTLLNRIVSE